MEVDDAGNWHWYCRPCNIERASQNAALKEKAAGCAKHICESAGTVGELYTSNDVITIDQLADMIEEYWRTE